MVWTHEERVGAAGTEGDGLSISSLNARGTGGKAKGDNMLDRVKNFLKSEDGPTATEYAVMLALIIIVALGAITLLGNKVNTIFTNVESALPDGT